MGISTTDKYKRQQKYKDKYNRQIQRQIQKTNTKDKRQKTKDKRQKTKDKRQKTIPADDERMMVPLKSFNSITYKAYQKQLMLGLFLFSSLLPPWSLAFAQLPNPSLPKPQILSY